MRNPKVNYVAVGSFVLVMGVAFLVSVSLLAGRTGAMTTYYTHFDNVTGVIPGTQLMFEGLRVGQVEAIEPASDPTLGRYRVELSVQEGWPIPDDSVATITEPGLLAAITVDIKEGQNETLVPPGGTIPGRDLQSVFTLVGTLAGEVEHIIEKDIRPLLDEVARVAPRMLADMESVTSDLAAATGRVESVFSDENTAAIDGMIGNLASASESLDGLTGELETSLVRLDDMAASLQQLIEGSSEDVESAVEDLRHTMDSVASHVDTINANLEATTHNMNEFSRQLRQNPGVLLRGTSGGGDDADPR